MEQGRVSAVQCIDSPRDYMVGRQLITVECKVRDEADHLVASADFSMMRVALRAAPPQPDEPESPQL